MVSVHLGHVRVEKAKVRFELSERSRGIGYIKVIVLGLGMSSIVDKSINQHVHFVN